MRDSERVRTFIKRAIPFILYFCVWFPLFFLLHARPVEKYYEWSLKIDQSIPYVKYFVLPYFLWFPWLAFVYSYAAWTDGATYYAATRVSMIGRAIYLLISFLWPTALALRPTGLQGTDIFLRLTLMFYNASGEILVFPSTHVYDTCVTLYAIYKGPGLFQKRWFRCCAIVFCVSVCLSTVLIRQHSVVDVAGGIVLFGLVAAAYEWLLGRQVERK